MLKTIDDFFDAIDQARSSRARELSEIKRLFGTPSSEPDILGVRSKALVVLSYAAWEGFYNECVDHYCEFLKAHGKKVSESGWRMLVGALSAEFNSLKDQHFSPTAKKEFVEKLEAKIHSDFNKFDRMTVKARSNLDWDKLSHNFTILDFDIDPFRRHFFRLNKEIVGWRHGVAHGSAPDLDTLDAGDHVNLVGEVMLLVADSFQAAMIRHI